MEQREGSSARMEAAPFGQGDHFLGERANGLCFGQRRLNPTVLDQAACLVGQQGVPMLRCPAELNRFLTMTHVGLLDFACRVDKAGFKFHA
jgi:hypothetical protein